jgi:hypothetical protein
VFYLQLTRHPENRQPRTVVSLSMPHQEWLRANRAAGMKGMKLSEYIRAAVQDQNRVVLVDEPPQLKAA